MDNKNSTKIHISKVCKNTDPVRLATSINYSLLEGKVVEVIAMGKNCSYIASKALILAKTFSEQNGISSLSFQPSFKIVKDAEDKNKTAISWTVSK